METSLETSDNFKEFLSKARSKVTEESINMDRLRQTVSSGRSEDVQQIQKKAKPGKEDI